MAKGLGREKTRKLLGLAVWEVELAVEAGLLRRLPDRTFDPVSVYAAQADGELFRRILAAERRCDVTESAARLGVSAAAFQRIAAALTPVATQEIRKYGRTLTVRYYRAADVDALAGHARAESELRAAARTVSRSKAAEKAARTRKANLARAAAARAEIDGTRPGPCADDPVRILLWTAALMIVADLPPGPLRALRRLADQRVEPLILMLRTARLSRTELETMLAELAGRSLELIGLLVPPAAAERELGLPLAALPVDLPRFGDHVLAPYLHELVSSPPSWLLETRVDRELAEAARLAAADLVRRQAATAEAAARAISRLSDEAVAEIFNLSVEVIRQLRPNSGRWSASLVTQWLRHTPPWLRDEAAARAEADRRRIAAAARVARRAAKRLSWRRRWAEEFGIPLDRVPERIGRPTPKAIDAARRDPPRWASQVGQADAGQNET
jgi:hypothetical protein